MIGLQDLEVTGGYRRAKGEIDDVGHISCPRMIVPIAHTTHDPMWCSLGWEKQN